MGGLLDPRCVRASVSVDVRIVCSVRPLEPVISIDWVFEEKVVERWGGGLVDVDRPAYLSSFVFSASIYVILGCYINHVSL